MGFKDVAIEIHELYESGMTISDISEITGISHDDVRYVIAMLASLETES